MDMEFIAKPLKRQRLETETEKKDGGVVSISVAVFSPPSV
jgi:hypothetical protein